MLIGVGLLAGSRCERFAPGWKAVRRLFPEL